MSGRAARRPVVLAQAGPKTIKLGLIMLLRLHMQEGPETILRTITSLVALLVAVPVDSKVALEAVMFQNPELVLLVAAVAGSLPTLPFGTQE